ncbi:MULTISPECIES: hypothetical protein [Microbulbifer]|uniref:hypothetical protein n=1 Tax=Microbulbifer TaxID=48073 RepID=UPI001E406091|nr:MULTISPECIES: hypothetical protein [Microbulbifer]UHQ54962.1 hypothetical protein LVE68_15860 [Microbulbifer sp. YPW16]
MKKLLLTLAVLLLASPAFSREDYLPSDNLGRYIYEKLDLSTFRNSFGPRRSEDDRLFSDLGLKPTEIKDDAFTIETDSWRYQVSIVRVKDINRDGIKDVEICFKEQSKTGTYNAQSPLLITQFSESGNLVALGYKVSGCESFAH